MHINLLLLLSLIWAPATICAQDAVVSECAHLAADTLISQRVVAALEAIGGPGTKVAESRRFCGDSSKSLALVDLPARDIGQERGWRFALLVDSTTTPVVRYVTQGFVDSYLPEFRLFRSGVEYLVLAGLGDEGGSWGIATFDTGPFVIAPLGHLDVGIPGADDPGNDQSALGAARVSHPIDGWRVSFGRTIVLRPNQDSRKEITPARGASVIFTPGQNWRPIH